MLPLNLIKKITTYVIIVCIFLCALQFGIKSANIPSYIFPLPTEVIGVFFNDTRLLYESLLITLSEWSIGVMLAIILGIAIALLTASYKPINRIASPLLLISQCVPYLVFVPLLLLWFGLGYSSKIIIVTLTCMFPIALVLKNDLINAQKEYFMIVQILKLSHLRALYHIYFPVSLPGFFNALKLSVSYAFGSTVVAELMGGEGGLGIFLLQAEYSYRTDRVLAVAVIVIGISLLSMFFVNLVSRKVVFWNRIKK